MKRFRFTQFTAAVFGSSASVIAVVFFLMLGISAGTFSALLLAGEEKEQILALLSQYLLLTDPTAQPMFETVLVSSLKNNLVLLLVILLSGLSVVGFPAALIALTYKGLAIGFSAALLIDNMDLTGIAVTLASILPQNLLILPGLLLGALAALFFALESIRQRGQGIRKNLASGSGPYLLMFLPAALLVLAGSFIESALCPVLIRLIV